MIQRLRSAFDDMPVIVLRIAHGGGDIRGPTGIFDVACGLAARRLGNVCGPEASKRNQRGISRSSVDPCGRVCSVCPRLIIVKTSRSVQTCHRYVHLSHPGRRTAYLEGH